MRLISKTKAAKPATNTQENSFYVEKARGNVIPKHFFEAKKAKVTINGKSVELMMNADRSAYVAFELDKTAYYVKDHSFFAAGTIYEDFIKPVKEKPAKKTKVTKPKTKTKTKKAKTKKTKTKKPAVKADKDSKTEVKEDVKYELIDTKSDETPVEINTADVFVKRFGASDFEQMVKGKHSNFIANELI